MLCLSKNFLMSSASRSKLNVVARPIEFGTKLDLAVMSPNPTCSPDK